MPPKSDTFSLPPSKAVWNLVLLCRIEHQKNHAVPNSACHPAADTSHAVKQCQVTTLLTELQWLPVAACIKFNWLMLTYRVLAGSASSYFNSPAWARVTPCSLCSTQEPHLAVCASMAIQTVLKPIWWSLLTSVRAKATLFSFKKLLKTQLYWEHLHS